MARLFINIWPFTTKTICSKAFDKFWQSGFKVWPNIRKTFRNNSKMAKFRQIWSHWTPRLFKSGHTHSRDSIYLRGWWRWKLLLQVQSDQILILKVAQLSPKVAQIVATEALFKDCNFTKVSKKLPDIWTTFEIKVVVTRPFKNRPIWSHFLIPTYYLPWTNSNSLLLCVSHD